MLYKACLGIDMHIDLAILDIHKLKDS